MTVIKSLCFTYEKRAHIEDDPLKEVSSELSAFWLWRIFYEVTADIADEKIFSS